MKDSSIVSATGERMIPGLSSSRNEADHIKRYEFAESYVSGKKVLDLACGSGFGSAMLADAGADSVVGIDISPEAIDYAKANFARPRVEFLVGSAEAVDLPSESFDVIVSFETIEHLPEAIRVSYLDELRRLLSPRGVILLSTPNAKVVSPWTRKPGNKFHVLEYSEASLAKELAEHHLKITKCFGQRLIPTFYTWLPIRILEVIRCRIMGKTSERYFEANGPELLDIPKWYTARYFVTEVKKM